MKLARRFNERLSIGNKIGVLLVVMVLVAGINVATVYQYQSEVSTLGNSVNYAGQQRMLSQRMAFTGYMLSQGHDDQAMMQETINQFDRNLDAVSSGGTIDGNRLQPAPVAVQDELSAEREFWSTYRAHAQTLVDEDPYNPDFQKSLNYLVDNSAAADSTHADLVAAYTAAGDQYTEEAQAAKALRADRQQIIRLALEIKHATSQPGSESMEKVNTQEDDAIASLQAELAETIESYDARLAALQSGGTVDGESLDAPPAGAESTIADVTAQWSDTEPHARTIATQDRLNPAFWKSLSYVEKNSDKLKSISNDAVLALSTESADRIAFMQRILLLLFGLNVVVFLIGVYVARRYIGRPIQDIADLAATLSRGEVGDDVTARLGSTGESAVDPETLNDEIVHLRHSFHDLGSYLSTVAEQADAIARQEFNDEVLDREVPGTFGESITTMAADVEGAQTAAEEARVEVEELNHALEAQAQRYNEVMNEAAEGDLTVRVDPESESEAMTKIGTAFNEMLAEIEETVLQVQSFADEVAETSQSVASSTAEIETASQDVAESVQEIAHGADDQAEQLATTVDEMNNLSATVEEIASSADEVVDTARQALSRAGDGREQAADASSELDHIQNLSGTAVEQVDALDSEIGEVGDIVQMISNIAEQTNLLALNASIEAARAGEAGGGFAVVADEIKTLANEAALATEEIEQLISGIQASTDETVADIEAMQSRVESGASTIKASIQQFDDIAESVEDAENGVTQISQATNDQATSTETVVAMVEDVASVSEQTADEATNVSSATEEQTASINTVSDSVRSLSDVAEDLHGVVGQFEVSDATLDGTTPRSGADTQVQADGGHERADGDR